MITKGRHSDADNGTLKCVILEAASRFKAPLLCFDLD
jgi:hypothetical protein